MNYLIVGAGISGVVAAITIHDEDPDAKITIVERRNHIGGNCASSDIDGIAVHRYGPHIFHTDNEKLWKWFTRRCPLVPYTHQVKALAPNGKMYSLPFSLQTAYEMFGATKEEEFRNIVNHEVEIWKEDHRELDMTTAEGFAISRIGFTMYMNLVRGYTEKQWGVKPSQLPASIVGRLPVRNTFGVGYYADRYVGIPKDARGYMPFFERVKGIARVLTESDWKSEFEKGKYDAVIYTGAVDEFFHYEHGMIEYRTSVWQYDTKPVRETTGLAVLNYTGKEYPHTRRIEYRYLQGKCDSEVTHFAFEYSEPFRDQIGGPMYVVPTEENNKRVRQYAKDAERADYKGKPVLFVGRLAQSRYLDMNRAIENAYEKVCEFLEKVSKNP